MNPFRVGMITQVTAIQSVADSGLQPQGATGALPRHLQDLVDQTCDDLDARQRHRLAEVLSEYADIFPVPGDPLTIISYGVLTLKCRDNHNTYSMQTHEGTKITFGMYTNKMLKSQRQYKLTVEQELIHSNKGLA